MKISNNKVEIFFCVAVSLTAIALIFIGIVSVKEIYDSTHLMVCK